MELKGKIRVKEYEFCKMHDCSNGFMIYNEKGEHFVLCWNEYQQCCEYFVAQEINNKDIMKFTSDNGCEITIDELTLKERRKFDLSEDAEGTAFNIISGEEKYRFIIFNDHNGYYAHDVCYTENGELKHTYI